MGANNVLCETFCAKVFLLEPHFESAGWAGLGWAAGLGGWLGGWLGWLVWLADGAGGAGRHGVAAGLGWVGLRLGLALEWGNPETEIGLFENGNIIRPKI